jgi:osmoprotectant transport system substrate-binding protein
MKALFAVLVASFVLAACGDDNDTETTTTGGASTTAASPEAAAPGITKDDALSSTTLTIGSKNFTEQKILGEVYAQALAAKGYTVDTDLNLGDEKTALKALKSGDIDAYPEYSGTALLSFFDKKADELPKDPQEAATQVQELFVKDGIKAFDPTPFTSSNEVAVTKETAEELGLKTISDLSDKAKDLTLYGSPECRQRLDCLLGLEQVYGLKFKKFTPIDIAKRHEVLTSGRADVSIVFTTDPQIKREGFILLEDDKGMFPPYNSMLLMTQETADKAGEGVQEVITAVQEGLTDEAMQELNARVDLDKKDPKTVAGEYLKESGLIGG